MASSERTDPTSATTSATTSTTSGSAAAPSPASDPPTTAAASAASAPASSTGPAPASGADAAGYRSGQREEGLRHDADTSGAEAATPLERARISCEMNARYHGCREAFLDTTHRWFMFGIIAFGAAALVDVLPHGMGWLRGVLPAGAAILGALDLTFDLSNRARMHALMKRRYFELLADVIEGKKDLETLQAAVNRINADEEPAYHALIGSCWNAAQEMVYGERADALRIPRHHLALKNIFRFASQRYSLKV